MDAGGLIIKKKIYIAYEKKEISGEGSLNTYLGFFQKNFEKH